MKARCLAVVGTDTGVGKTFAAAALRDYLQAKDHSATAIKPFVSGNENGSWNDLDILNEAGETLLPPARYIRPLSPYGAERRGEKEVSLADTKFWLESFFEDESIVIIEGIGGLMVPLKRDTTWIDLHAEYRWPALLVARAGLGTLNHTLLSLEALSVRNIPIAGFVLAASSVVDPVDAEENASIISEMSEVECLGVVQYDSEYPERRWASDVHWKSLERRLCQKLK